MGRVLRKFSLLTEVLMSQIKWAYDESTGGFSALPASPFLLPVLGLVCLAPLLDKLLEAGQRNPQPCDANPGMYERYKQEYHRLAAKQLSANGLEDGDLSKMHRLMFPPWATPGEVWTY